MTTATAISSKCKACGAESLQGRETCQHCGSGNLLDRRRQFHRAVALSILIVAVVLLVAAMVYGEVHRATGPIAIGL